MSHEEFDGEQFAFQTIAVGAGRHEVTEGVCPAVGERVDVVECSIGEFQRGRAIDASAAAIAHGGAFKRVLLAGCR